MYGWSVAAIASLFSVAASVELVKWTRATPGFFSFFKKVNFENYKFLFLVIIVSSLLNGLLVNVILSLINQINTIDVITVFRFAIGDFLGSIAVIATLYVIFRTLVDTRLIIDPRLNNK
jgi:Co/Zn/Cd efflux system component